MFAFRITFYQYIYIYIILGHYGDVQRVKILYNKKDTALIQFADASQATTGNQHFNV